VAARHGRPARANFPLSDSMVVDQPQPACERPALAPTTSPSPPHPISPQAKRTFPPPTPPQAAWRAGVQMVALNLQTNDAPVQLHDALFRGSGGYVLKPAALRAPDRAMPPPIPPNRSPRTPSRLLFGSGSDRASGEGSLAPRSSLETEPLQKESVTGRGKQWPPPRVEVHRTSLKAAARLAAAPLGPLPSQLTERPTAA